MYYNEFFNKLKKNTLATFYLFMGEENYMMDLAIESLKNKYIDKSLESINFTRIQGKESDLNALINACETLPFMSEKRLVLIKDIFFFIKELTEKQEKEFYKYINTLGDHICLILLDDDFLVRKNSKLYRRFKKTNNVVEFTKLRGRDLNQWVMGVLKRNNKKMLSSNINYFIDISSYRSQSSK